MGLRFYVNAKQKKTPIPPDDIKKFYSNLDYEIGKKYVDIGFFFSISGFTSNADRWYKDSGHNIKRILTLKGTREIVELLRDASLLASDECLDRIVQNNTSYELAERRIDVFQSDVFIMQNLRVGGETTSYMILKGNGNVVPLSVMEEISKLDNDLKNYSRLNPSITRKVTLNLLDLKLKSCKTIAVEIKEMIEDVRVALNDLRLQKIVIQHKDSTGATDIFSISQDLDRLRTMTERFASENNRFSFMSSSSYIYCG
jgi:hypothetical protein